MESLPNTKVLHFHSDTLTAVRTACSLHKPGEMSEAVDILDKWVKQQIHFRKKDFDKSYLERAIIDAKGSLTRAKERTEKLCTYKTLIPQYFGDFNIREDFEELDGKVMFAPLRQLTKDHYRVIVIQNFGQQFESTFLTKIGRVMCMALEYLKAHEYNNGVIAIFDHTFVNWMELINKLPFSELRQIFAILLGGYGVKIKEIHILASSNLVDIGVTLLKRFLSAKVASRIRVHTSMNTLYDYVPKESLPSDYGGNEKSLEILYEQCKDVFSSKEQRDYIREMCRAGTDESLRQTGQFNEMYMGTPGTFRTLNVD